MRKILIIEDEILIQQSLKLLLEAHSCQVAVTASGAEAIRLISQQKFDKIVCDLMLQDISGFDVIEDSLRVMSRDEIKERFIIISAYMSEQILSRARQYGCLFFSKPFDNISDTINQIIA
jgi:CheY-like chemotaxis protein